MGESILQLDHLTKRFGRLTAVDSVSLQVQKGEVFGFLGPNGAGKTTAIGMILGLIHADGGAVRVFNEPVTPRRNRALQRVGALVGPPALLPYLSARRNLDLLTRLPGCAGRSAIDPALEWTGLLEAADRPAGHFSTGMKQRLGLAMALMHGPELLVLDEPTNGMDPGGMHEIRDLLRGLAGRGITIFLSSHLLHEVEQVCDRVAILRRGRTVAVGTVEALLGNTQLVHVQAEEPAVAAQALQSLAGATQIAVSGSTITLRHPSSKAVNQHLARHGIFASSVTVARPDLESIFLELTGKADDAEPAQAQAANTDGGIDDVT